MKPQEIEAYMNALKKEADIQNSIKQTMQFPSRDLAQLFEKFADPQELKEDQAITREVNTANFDNNTFMIVATQLSLRKDFQQFKKQFLLIPEKEEEIAELKTKAKEGDQEAEKRMRDIYDKQKASIWIDSIIETIGSDAVIIAASSKGREGWLGELIISSKRIGEVFTFGMGDKIKKGLFR